MTNRVWNHQAKSIEFALGKKAVGIWSGCGSGKTRIAIEVIQIEKHELVLVVVPKSALIDGVWDKQIRQYFKGIFQICPLVKGSTKDKVNELSKYIMRKPAGVTLFVLVNYDTVWRSPLGPKVLDVKWDCVVLDEAHRIKAAGSQVSRFMARLGVKMSFKKKIALTGTPTPNSPLDAYGVYRFLDNSVFGTNYKSFSSRYAVFGGFNMYQVLRYINLDDLREKMSSIAIRFETADVIDLPETMNIFRDCDLDPETRKIYDTLEDEFTAELKGGRITVPTVLVKTVRMCQLTGGFAKLDGTDILVKVHDSKLGLLEEVLSELPTQFSSTVRSGLIREPVVIFAQFRADIDAIRATLDKIGYQHGELSGKHNDLQSWHAKTINALVVQIAAGSESIDLSRSSYAVYYSPCWGLGPYDQSRARLHRPGQRHPVRFIHLVVRNTIDNVMYRALHNKKEVNNYIMEVYQRGDQNGSTSFE